jgi:hypothetical protein
MSDSLYHIKNFLVAQVINKKTEGDTYKSDNPDNLYAINARVYINSKFETIKNIQPWNSNIKQIPVTGESILIFETINEKSGYKTEFPKYYYIQPLNLQSNINNNILPTTEQDPELDSDFDASVATSPLQPYRGDLLIEGRWGNSIRFGSTITSGNYNVPTTWKGSKTGDPILILSNTTKRETGKKFITESLKDDKSASISLSSTQQFRELDLKKSLRKYTKETEYNQSQLVAQANRIVLRSDKDVTIIDSNKAVVLNSDRVLIGNDKAESPMVHGDELFNILKEMLSIMLTGYTGVAGFPVFHQRSADIIRLTTELNKIKSNKYFIKK